MCPATNRAPTSLNSRSPSRWHNQRSAAASNNVTNTMPATRFQTSSTMSESAVSETVRRVNATALDLLTRRAEINKRIRCLHQVVQGLRDLGLRDLGLRDLGSRDLGSRDLGLRNLATVTTSHATTARFTGERELRVKSPGEPTAGGRRSAIASGSRRLRAGLTRACRIALMEAGGAASLDEIRSRIVRRGSFSFYDSSLAEAAMIRTLHSMTADGEIRRVEDGPQSLWQRICPTGEIDI
jgi:hypothetical protein